MTTKKYETVLIEKQDVITWLVMNRPEKRNAMSPQLHIEMDGGMSLTRAHEISDKVEAELRAAYPHAEVIIHQDPEGIEEPRSNFTRRVGAR